MDEEIRMTLAELRNDIKELRRDHNCPQPGCRYMESKGARIGTIANWLTTFGLVILLVEKFLGGTP